MLREIFIRNYALIEELQLELGDGLSIITGETGSGKSIIIGALGLVLGERADTGVLYDKEKKCIVEGAFEIEPYGLEPLFEELDLDYEPETRIRREVNPKGRSRAFVNDTPVRLEALKRIGERLVDIHSQDQARLLKDKGFRTVLLDSFAGQEELMEVYGKTYQEYRSSSTRLQELQEKEKQAKADLDYYQFQLQELEEQDLDPERFHQEEEELKRLDHAEDLRNGLNSAARSIRDESSGVQEGLRKVKGELENLTDIDKRIDELYDRVESSFIEIGDIGQELERLNEDVDVDPQKVQALTDRIDRLNNLMHKHNVETIEELSEVKEGFRRKVQEMERVGEDLEELQQKVDELEEQVSSIADQLTKGRSDIKGKVEGMIGDLLGELGMDTSSMEIRLVPEDNPGPFGNEAIGFSFISAPGAQPKELTKVASGGERSRVMLALRAIFSEVRTMPSMILDEIDTGISGDIAEKAGEVMKRMSRRSQVISITHLPQIAGKGDGHFKVIKENTENGVRTRILPLSQKDRIEEIARMLSGEELTDAAMEHAKSLMGA